MCILHIICVILYYVQYAHNMGWKKGVNMKAAIVKDKGTIPVMGHCDSPLGQRG